MSLHLPIDSICDTAFVTAYCRALESDRVDAHFRDPYARQLAGARGKQCVERFPGGRASSAGCIVRTILIDEFVLAEIRNRGIDGVVNLGAGLDTRPFRLPIPPSLRWYDVDSPEVLHYKAGQLRGCRSGCTYEAVAADVTDPEQFGRFFSRVATTIERLLVLTEGVLIYLTGDQVAGLASDLHRYTTIECWITDLASPNLLQLGQALDFKSESATGVAMRFAPADGHRFFQKYGWQAEEARSCLEEGTRLDRWSLPESAIRDLTREQWELLRMLTTVVKFRRVESTSRQPLDELSREREQIQRVASPDAASHRDKENSC